ncbi:protein O-linked-mannose beta-1,2-N-acetylglucosaminyltransferase 1-like [Lineus longissimus]|uniref:protein O-linked-mannose beta-1,2-N-acetylglucosaminyltransferase 1-like n=1 Tax=Lineus longissimus TaxID=88925 RepID=UPI00315D4E40
MVIVDDVTKKVTEIKHFDTYLDDASMVRYLKLVIPDNHIILVASSDEMTYNLHEDAKGWLMKYGSQAITGAKFRDNFVMIGQRGLTPGAAVEQLIHRNVEEEFAQVAEIKGCLSVPMGPLTRIEISKPQIGDKSSMEPGWELPNCGLEHPCGPNTFPVHIFTAKGRNNIRNKGPKICVNGQYVLSAGVNDAGRGFNIAIVDPIEIEVVRVGHFDTYAEDSSHLEIFLEMIKEGEIVLAVTHDDASRKLSDHAKHLFNELGSSQIQNIRFRDNWYFVGQKGINGFGDRELLENAGQHGEWPKPLDKKMCIPTRIQGYRIKPDPLVNRNMKRREFCSKFDGYGDFCDVNRVDEPLRPAPLTDRVLQGHAISAVPIVVIPGMNYNGLRMLLETVLMQPGVDPKMVLVTYDEKFYECAELAKVFDFIPIKLNSSGSYIAQMHQAIEAAWKIFPNKESVIILEEDLVLSPDFLYFLAQTYQVVRQDKSLLGISAWNDNGYEEVSTNSTLVYRISSSFPGFAFLLQRAFFENHMKNNQHWCCWRRSWQGWFPGGLNGSEILIPDVSRVFHLPYVTARGQMHSTLSKELFNRKRVTSREQKVQIAHPFSLTREKYEDELFRLIRSSQPIKDANFLQCIMGNLDQRFQPAEKGKVYIVYYEQDEVNDFILLRRLCQCFGLFSLDDYPPRNLHRGLVRFNYFFNEVLLVGSGTEYYVYKPPSIQSLSKDILRTVR